MSEPAPPGEAFAAVYDELKRLAAAQLARESPGHTLDATALVHEAYLRLGRRPDSARPVFETRGHFFAAAAEAMRRILLDHARRKQAAKRGGKAAAGADPDQLPAPPDRDADLLAVDEALARLAAADPQAAELVKLRYFGGLTIPEAAEALGISPRSADRLWAYAKAWLYRELSAGERPG